MRVRWRSLGDGAICVDAWALLPSCAQARGSKQVRIESWPRFKLEDDLQRHRLACHKSFRNSILMGAPTRRERAGYSELRSAAPAIQGGGQADQNSPATYRLARRNHILPNRCKRFVARLRKVYDRAVSASPTVLVLSVKGLSPMQAICMSPRLYLTVFWLGGILLCSNLQGEPFRNLNFEETVGVHTGIPGWVIPPGIDYLYDSEFAGEGAVSLITPAFGSTPFPPFQHSLVIEGNQSVLMVYDYAATKTGGAITQVGDIPQGASRMEMLITDATWRGPGNADGVRLSLNGITIPLSVSEQLDRTFRVSGDVSGFAGTTALLRIESPFGAQEGYRAVFDVIQFVVPEPTAFWLASLGFVGLAAWGWQRKG